MNRRHFIIEAGKAFPVVAGALYVVGCDSSSNESSSFEMPDGDTGELVIVASSTFDAGHSHSAEIPLSDLSSTIRRTYNSSDSSGHTHQVALTATQLSTIGNGSEVTVTSSDADGHTHRFSFNKTDTAPPTY